MNIFELNASEVDSEGGSAYWEAGVSKNAELSKVVYELNKEGGDKYGLGFYYKNAAGAEKRLAFEWLLDTSREDFKKKLASLMKRLTHVANKYMAESEINISAATLEEGYQKYAKLFIGKDLSKKINVKAVYNDKDYLGTPPYTPFIELATASPSTLKISDSERITRKPKPASADLEFAAPVEMNEWN